MKNVKNQNGLFLVSGKGFITAVQAQATKFSERDATNAVNAALMVGVVASIVDAPVEVDPNIKQNPDGTSYAVSFVRAKDLDGAGGVKAHKLNPSKRRFATHAEAVHHGSRFMGIEKHLGFYVVQTKDPVNAYVNKVTGKTNPEIGKKRTNR